VTGKEDDATSLQRRDGVVVQLEHAFVVLVVFWVGTSTLLQAGCSSTPTSVIEKGSAALSSPAQRQPDNLADGRPPRFGII
jgi:hypothetical protein